MQQAWVGRTRQDLTRAFGLPTMVMTVPGARLPEAIILVFKGKDPISGCIDAFVVLRDDDEQIWNYFCR